MITLLTYPDHPQPGSFPVPCPSCSGDGGHEGPFCHVDYRNGSAWGDWYECRTCRGSGSVDEDCLPDQIDGDELDDYRADAPVEEAF